MSATKIPVGTRSSSARSRSRTLAPIAALLSLLACVRPKDAPPPPASSSEHRAAVCLAAAAPSRDEGRFARVFPVAGGGAVFVFARAKAAEVRATLDALGLQHAEVVACRAVDVVVFVPGVDRAGATRLEAELLANVAGAKTIDRIVVPAQSARASRD